MGLVVTIQLQNLWDDYIDIYCCDAHPIVATAHLDLSRQQRDEPQPLTPNSGGGVSDGSSTPVATPSPHRPHHQRVTIHHRTTPITQLSVRVPRPSGDAISSRILSPAELRLRSGAGSGSGSDGGMLSPFERQERRERERDHSWNPEPEDTTERVDLRPNSEDEDDANS
jgi:hypothetical protein